METNTFERTYQYEYYTDPEDDEELPSRGLGSIDAIFARTNREYIVVDRIRPVTTIRTIGHREPTVLVDGPWENWE